MNSHVLLLFLDCREWRHTWVDQVPIASKKTRRICTLMCWVSYPLKAIQLDNNDTQWFSHTNTAGTCSLKEVWLYCMCDWFYETQTDRGVQEHFIIIITSYALGGSAGFCSLGVLIFLPLSKFFLTSGDILVDFFSSGIFEIPTSDFTWYGPSYCLPAHSELPKFITFTQWLDRDPSEGTQISKGVSAPHTLSLDPTTGLYFKIHSLTDL